MPRPPDFENWDASIDPGFGPYRAVVQRVVDGDTVYVLIDAGFSTYCYHSIRLWGVDAPELFTSDPVEKAKGAAAKAYLEFLLPPATKCELTTDKDKTTFGRYIAAITLADGRDIGTEMVNAGHAEWST